MGAWDLYQSRLDVHGNTKRNASLIREVRYINTKLPDNLSYTTVEMHPMEYGYNIESDEMREHIITQDGAIINSDNLDEKTMIAMPGADIELGTLVHWMDNYWLVVERDANTTIYTKTKLLQCNHLLHWIEDREEGLKIIAQWCVIEDGTKYLTGEYEDRNFVVTRGDSRISMQIARNKYTVEFDRERRFLIDDPESPHKLAYLLTKPLKLGFTYNNQGTLKFVLQEVTATQDDNHELGIADYYKYTKKDPEFRCEHGVTEEETPSGKKVWI